MLRRPFRPLRPELDKFLLAAVGPEVDGLPLSAISALARLGLDPREEAGRLSSLSAREAAEQLARLIVELPEQPRSLQEARVIAKGLVDLLPEHGPGRISAPQVPMRQLWRAAALPKRSPLWIACLVLAAAVLLSAVIHGGFPFGIGNP